MMGEAQSWKNMYVKAVGVCVEIDDECVDRCLVWGIEVNDRVLMHGTWEGEQH